jgi:hypothetical protein
MECGEADRRDTLRDNGVRGDCVAGRTGLDNSKQVCWQSLESKSQVGPGMMRCPG